MDRRLTLFCAALLLSTPARAELVTFEESGSDVHATLKIERKEYRLDAKMLRTKAAAPGGALLVDAAQNEDLAATALGRGMNVFALDLGKLPAPARAQALRDLLPRLRETTRAKRVLARGAGETGATLAEVGPLFDGLLLHDARAANGPRSIETWGSDAYWRAPPPPAPAGPDDANLRRFFVAGTTTIAGANCLGPLNTRSQAPALRALLVVLDDWAKGVKPPASRVPAVADLVDARKLVWPKIPALPTPPSGERLVPKIDADGNESAGLRLPDQALPIATFTGFGVQKDKAGPGCAAGVALPFPSTKTDREKTGDPRPSLVERYGSRAYFVATMRVVADKLVKERLLLKEDADAYVAAARTAPF
ncbi:alpha/beta hydrolase domain-containing protein [Methylocystis iwaonis]|uniref:alpha/beta hydrolase domain-containing protein n=1 Tax=Methylocystis iwaonis TaxID=2885079 RepID=UPI002E7B163A|nr:alpha/beta hydrolase domain-containing protein [Methylocystis iwaonis]